MPELDDIITIVDEDGNEHDVCVFGVLEVDGNKYAILAPMNEDKDDVEQDGESGEDGEGGDAFVLRFDQDEDGNEIMVGIDDEEWEKVKHVCMEELDEIDFIVEE